MKDSNKRLAILISGGGTTARAILQAWKEGQMPGVRPVLMVASRASAPGLGFAKGYGIESAVVDPKSFDTAHDFNAALLATLQAHHVDIVSQNGWLPLMPQTVIQAYVGSIINQHPGPLDPGRIDFGGKGMFGKRVTCARIAYAWMSGEDFWTEATVHHVTEEFDKGALVASVRVNIPRVDGRMSYESVMAQSDRLVKATHDVATLLLTHEHAMVIDVLKHLGKTGALPARLRSTALIPEEKKHTAQLAKEISFRLFAHG